MVIILGFDDGVRGIRLIKWDGKLCQDSEHLVLIKTITSNYELVVARLRSLHPYEVPEIIALPAIAVEQNYLLWAKSILL
jgi:uncharacterized protein involved in tolerance to divalent cations